MSDAAGPEVWVFFYGSYINRDVLAQAGLAPSRWEVARLDGFELVVRPRANLVRSDRHCAWGVLATATHRELDRLYAHARGVVRVNSIDRHNILYDKDLAAQYLGCARPGSRAGRA